MYVNPHLVKQPIQFKIEMQGKHLCLCIKKIIKYLFFFFLINDHNTSVVGCIKGLER